MLPDLHVQGKVWKQVYGWDEDLQNEFMLYWNRATEDWSKYTVELPSRCFMLDKGESIRVYKFTIWVSPIRVSKFTIRVSPIRVSST